LIDLFSYLSSNLNMYILDTVIVPFCWYTTVDEYFGCFYLIKYYNSYYFLSWFEKFRPWF